MWPWLGTRATVVRAQCVRHQQVFVGGHFHLLGVGNREGQAADEQPEAGASHAQLNTKPSWESLKTPPQYLRLKNCKGMLCPHPTW